MRYLKNIKKFLLAIAALVISVSSASAAGSRAVGPRVVDQAGVLSDEDLSMARRYLDERSASAMFDVVVAFVDSTDGMSAADMAEMLFNDGDHGWGTEYDGAIWLLSVEDGDWGMAVFGRGTTAFPNDVMEKIGDAVTDAIIEDGAVAGVTRFADLCVERVQGSAPSAPQSRQSAMPALPTERLAPRLTDDAGLLDDARGLALQKRLDEISTRIGFDFVAVTKQNIGSKTPLDFADDFFDYNGFGFGEGKDGALFLISMADRDWWISTSGFGERAFTTAGIEYIGKKITPLLSKGDYFGAINTLLDYGEDFVAQARAGSPYTASNLPRDPFSWIANAILAFVIALIVALIVVSSMKAQLKSVHAKEAASDYVRQGSMAITRSADAFLYSTVTKTAKPKAKSSSSGSHTSSSGRSHGGGGGKF